MQSNLDDITSIWGNFLYKVEPKHAIAQDVNQLANISLSAVGHNLRVLPFIEFAFPGVVDVAVFFFPEL